MDVFMSINELATKICHGGIRVDTFSQGGGAPVNRKQMRKTNMTKKFYYALTAALTLTALSSITPVYADAWEDCQEGCVKKQFDVCIPACGPHGTGSGLWHECVIKCRKTSNDCQTTCDTNNP